MPARYMRILFKDRHDAVEDVFYNSNGMVDITIDLEMKTVLNYPYLVECLIYSKVVDTGCYYLLDENKNVISEIIEEYVPKCVPNEYGDYLELDIDRFGVVQNWVDWKYNLKETIQEQFEREARK